MKTLTTLAALPALLFCTLSLHAGVVIDTYTAGIVPNSQDFPVGNAAQGWGWAVGFQTPAGQAYSLTAATFKLGFTPVNYLPAIQSAPVLNLFQDNGGSRPGDLIAALALSSPAYPTGTHSYVFQNYTYAPASPIALAAGTKYWLGMNNVCCASNEVFLVGDVGKGITGAATYLGAVNSPGAPLNLESIPYFSVAGDAGGPVPEPGTALLLGGACLFVCARAARHRD